MKLYSYALCAQDGETLKLAHGHLVACDETSARQHAEIRALTLWPRAKNVMLNVLQLPDSSADRGMGVSPMCVAAGASETCT